MLTCCKDTCVNMCTSGVNNADFPCQLLCKHRFKETSICDVSTYLMNPLRSMWSKTLLHSLPSLHGLLLFFLWLKYGPSHSASRCVSSHVRSAVQHTPNKKRATYTASMCEHFFENQTSQFKYTSRYTGICAQIGVLASCSNKTFATARWFARFLDIPWMHLCHACTVMTMSFSIFVRGIFRKLWSTCIQGFYKFMHTTSFKVY